jgi:hypothetical protein
MFNFYLFVFLSNSGVHLIDLPVDVVPIVPLTSSALLHALTQDGSKPRRNVVRGQLPIAQAYAFTDYRSQGTNNTSCHCGPRESPFWFLSLFNVYVALSRSSGRVWGWYSYSIQGLAQAVHNLADALCILGRHASPPLPPPPHPVPTPSALCGAKQLGISRTILQSPKKVMMNGCQRGEVLKVVQLLIQDEKSSELYITIADHGSEDITRAWLRYRLVLMGVQRSPQSWLDLKLYIP